MNVSTEEVGAVTVLRIDGHLDTNTAPEAQERLDQLLDAGVSTVLVNFEDLDYISSAGLRVLLATAKRMSSEGGTFRICQLNETVNEVFEISGFSTIFDVFDTEADAMEGL